MANSIALILRRTNVQLSKRLSCFSLPYILDNQGNHLHVHGWCEFNNCFFMSLVLLVRTLYSPASLGIDGFLQQKTRTTNHFANISEKFVSKMKEFTADDSKGMVFTEDLKNMIHLASTDEDIELVVKMIKRSVLFKNYLPSIFTKLTAIFM